jgi:AraC-like DNA-binding protein
VKGKKQAARLPPRVEIDRRTTTKGRRTGRAATAAAPAGAKLRPPHVQGTEPAKAMRIFVPWSLPVYTPVKLFLLAEALLAEGVAALALRDATGDEKGGSISIDQMIAALGAAAQSGAPTGAAFRAGRRNRITSYGVYGFGLLSSPDFRQAIRFAVEYHHLASPTVQLSLEERGPSAAWRFDPLPHHAIDTGLYRFIVEMQIGILMALHSELVGGAFVPRELQLAYRCDAFARYFEQETGVPCRSGAKQNRMIFDAAHLNQAYTRGNATSFAEMKQLCERATLEIEKKSGLAAKIRACIAACDTQALSFEDVARRLNIPERTLRRRLNDENTSFSELVNDARRASAVKLLRDTALSLEDVAGRLGFSDAANFRHAFRRWTGYAPQEFRRRAAPA